MILLCPHQNVRKDLGVTEHIFAINHQFWEKYIKKRWTDRFTSSGGGFMPLPCYKGMLTPCAAMEKDSLGAFLEHINHS